MPADYCRFDAAMTAFFFFFAATLLDMPHTPLPLRCAAAAIAPLPFAAMIFAIATAMLMFASVHYATLRLLRRR